MFCDAEFVIEKENPRRVLVDTEEIMKLVILGKYQGTKSSAEPSEGL
jgi:hypothetical protein